MSQWFSEYGYLIGIFILVVIVFIVVLNRAAKAYSKHYNTLNEQKKLLEHMTALKNKYKNITPEELSLCSDSEILEGFATVYQAEIQKCDDMEAAFLSMTREKQYIYVLDVFVNDGSVGLFYSQNGEILTGIILEALRAIGMNDFAEKLFDIQKMYDKDDESISFSQNKIEDFDKSLNEKGVLTQIKVNSAKYIRENLNLL